MVPCKVGTYWDNTLYLCIVIECDAEKPYFNPDTNECEACEDDEEYSEEEKQCILIEIPVTNPTINETN